MKKIYLLLILILFLGVVLRFYQLGKTPVSLEWDEVALGYDAYSILNTGKDQFGKFLPLTFRSLDDYKPPIYEYLTVLPVMFFGLNAFSVRFSSAFWGSATVIFVYLLSKKIAENIPKLENHNKKIGLLGAFLFSVSPWSLQFSRAAFEVNVSVFITITAVYFFLSGISDKRKFILSAFLFGVDLFSYHSTRVVSPLLLVSLFLLFNKKLPNGKTILYFILVYFSFVIIFLPIASSSDAQIRFKATNIFNPGARYLDEKDLPKLFLDKRQVDKTAGYELAGKLYHNQRLIYFDYETLVKVATKYISHFNFEFLFIKGDAPLHHAPGMGLLYLWELPFIIIGLIYILKYGFNRYSALLYIWLLIAPIPASVTREAPHAVRSELFLPVYQIIAGIGIFTIFQKIKEESRWVSALFIILGTFLFMINNSYYLHQYYVHTNYELSANWIYGRKEAVEFTQNNKASYDKVLVSMNVDMPYIFWLFYSKYSPQIYIAEGGTVSGGFADERNHFDKYEFRNFNYNELDKKSKLLLVGIPGDFPPDAKFLHQINYLDGQPAIKIAENK